MALMPGFPSQEMIASSFCFFVDAAAAVFSAGRGYLGIIRPSWIAQGGLHWMQ
jgi:hypothetical protein